MLPFYGLGAGLRMADAMQKALLEQLKGLEIFCS